MKNVKKKVLSFLLTALMALSVCSLPGTGLTAKATTPSVTIASYGESVYIGEMIKATLTDATFASGWICKWYADTDGDAAGGVLLTDSGTDSNSSQRVMGTYSEQLFLGTDHSTTEYIYVEVYDNTEALICTSAAKANAKTTNATATMSHVGSVAIFAGESTSMTTLIANSNAVRHFEGHTITEMNTNDTTLITLEGTNVTGVSAGTATVRVTGEFGCSYFYEPALDFTTGAGGFTPLTVIVMAAPAPTATTSSISVTSPESGASYELFEVATGNKVGNTITYAGSGTVSWSGLTPDTNYRLEAYTAMVGNSHARINISTLDGPVPDPTPAPTITYPEWPTADYVVVDTGDNEGDGSFKLTIEPSQEGVACMEAMNATFPGYECAKTYQVNVFINEIQQDELGEYVLIKLNIPEEFRKAGRLFKIVSIHNGVAYTYDDIDNSDDTVTFKTRKFSAYGLYYTDDAGVVASPKTSDGTGYAFLWILFVFALGISGTIVYYKKKNV